MLKPTLQLLREKPTRAAILTFPLKDPREPHRCSSPPFLFQPCRKQHHLLSLLFSQSKLLFFQPGKQATFQPVPGRLTGQKSTFPSTTSSRQFSWEQARTRSPPTSFGSSLERTWQAGEQREQLVSPLFTRSTLPGLGWELMLARALQRESTRWVTPTTPVRRSIPVHFNSIEMFNFKSKGLVDCIGKSFKADGVVKGLYPGFLSSVQGIIIYR